MSRRPTPLLPRRSRRARHTRAILAAGATTTLVAVALTGCSTANGSGAAAGSRPAAASAVTTTAAPSPTKGTATPTRTGTPSHTPTGTGTGTGTGDGSGRVTPTSGSDTSAIKGWMTVQQVLDSYPVEQQALYRRFGIPADTPTSTTLQQLQQLDGSTFDVPDLRSWIDAGATA